MNIPSLARQLTDIVGSDQLLEDPAACAAYAVQGVVPDLVATPASIGELAQVIAAAHSREATVVPWGGGTRQSLGLPPPRIDLVVCTTRLNQIVEHEPGDLTISVEAGITMAALAAALATHNQVLPVDVALPARATLGGTLAAAADGPRRLGYGTLRDLLIGIKVVEATGRISKAGGMVVKNVSGFDMMKLYLGSLGSLAVIASANFKLIPRPRAAASVSCTFTDLAAAFVMVESIHTSQLTPTAVELLYGWELPSTIELVICAEGLPAAVQRHLRDLSHMAEQSGASDLQLLEGTDHTALWASIADLPQLAEVGADELVARIACLPGDLSRALADAVQLAEKFGLPLQIDARALSGLAYLRLNGPDEDLAAWYTALSTRWPQLNLLACPPALKPHLNLWGSPPPGIELMSRIKQEFDPQATLNPGRYIV